MVKSAAKNGTLLGLDAFHTNLFKMFKEKCTENNVNTITKVATELGKDSIF